MNHDARRTLEANSVPIEIKLALAWATLMFLYIYNDYFVMFTPGTIDSMIAGRMGPLGPATEGVLVGVAILLAVPALMIFLSVTLPTDLSRWLNVLLGFVYTAVEALTFLGPHLFYQIVVGFEIVVTLLIVWLALRWPKHSAAERSE